VAGLEGGSEAAELADELHKIQLKREVAAAALAAYRWIDGPEE
jgi:hypothetical protein